MCRIKCLNKIFQLILFTVQATVKLPLGDILCSSDEAQLMRLLMRLIKAKKVIKIGEMDI